MAATSPAVQKSFTCRTGPGTSSENWHPHWQYQVHSQSTVTKYFAQPHKNLAASSDHEIIQFHMFAVILILSLSSLAQHVTYNAQLSGHCGILNNQYSIPQTKQINTKYIKVKEPVDLWGQGSPKYSPNNK